MCKEYNLEGSIQYATLWNIEACISLAEAKLAHDSAHSLILLSDACECCNRSLEITAQLATADEKSLFLDQSTLQVLGRCRTLQIQQQSKGGKQTSPSDIEAANLSYERSLQSPASQLGHRTNQQMYIGLEQLKLVEGDLHSAKDLLIQGKSMTSTLCAPNEQPGYLAEACALLGETCALLGDETSSSQFILEALTAMKTFACQTCKDLISDPAEHVVAFGGNSNKLSDFNSLTLFDRSLCDRCRWRASRWSLAHKP